MTRFILVLSILFLLGAFQNVSAQKKTVKQKKAKPIVVSCGVCNQKAIYLAKPVYPEMARFRPGGTVKVEVLLDEKGKAESAKVISGHPFFRAEAVKAALKSKFEPVRVSGKPVKTRGIIVYNFVP